LPLIDCVDQVCEGCILGKHDRDSFPSSKSWRETKPLELVHANIYGPMKTLSLNKNKYFIIFVEDFSRRTWVYFITEKSYAPIIFYNFDDYCKKNGIYRKSVVGYTPQNNGVVERKNWTIVEMARNIH